MQRNSYFYEKKFASMFNYTPQISVPFLENERKTHRRCIISNYFETNKSVCLPYKNYNNNAFNRNLLR